MHQEFFSIVTTRGLSKSIQAKAQNQSLTLTKMAVGDSSEPITQSQTVLLNERYKFNINSLMQSQTDPNILIAEGLIPSSIGGFYIHQVAIYDSDDELFALAKVPATYKPNLEQGSSKDITIKFQMQLDNAENITLKVDNSITLATRDYVINELNKKQDKATSYTKTQSDDRYLQKSEKATDSNLLDGKDSTAFVLKSELSTLAPRTDLSGYATQSWANSQFRTSSQVESAITSKGYITQSTADSRYIKPSDTSATPSPNKIIKYDGSKSITASKFIFENTNNQATMQSSDYPLFYQNSTKNIYRATSNNFLNALSIYSKSECDSRYIKSSDTSTSPSSGKVVKYDGSNINAYGFKITNTSTQSMSNSSYPAFIDSSGYIQKASISSFLSAIGVYSKSESDTRYLHLVPAGMIIAFAGNASNKPSGYLLCDGSAVSRSTYADLFRAIGTTYGSGNGSSTFNLPDFRGCFLRGLGGDSATLGTKQTDAIRNITGYLSSYWNGVNFRFFSSGSGAFSVSGGSAIIFTGGNASANGYSNVNFNASNQVPTANENRPINFAINWLIKY